MPKFQRMIETTNQNAETVGMVVVTVNTAVNGKSKGIAKGGKMLRLRVSEAKASEVFSAIESALFSD